MPNDIPKPIIAPSLPERMRLPKRKARLGNKNGVALILVLAALSLITVILLGFTLDMQLEKQASQSSLTSLKSDNAVQAALAHAVALLAQNIPPVAHGSASTPAAASINNAIGNTPQVNWWVNPGLLSTQTGNGSPVQIPLYTTLSTSFNGSAYPPTDTAPATTTDSSTTPAQGVDLNRPTLRNSSVFTVTGSDPANPPPNNKMVVYWQYVVQDPTLPHNSATNPYVSRYAYWMEPENSRIDISTAFGKDPANPPDAAGGTAATPSFSLPTFTVLATPTPLSNNETIGNFFTLGNPASVDLGVLKVPSGTFYNFFDTSKFFNAQQFTQRGNAPRGGTVFDTTPFNLLPLGGDPTTPATLDDTEQIKNFVKSGFTAQQGEQFYTDNQFYLTNYSRDPEFNVFGGARLYCDNIDSTTSWFSVEDFPPSYQYFWNIYEPTMFPGGGSASSSYGRTYLGILYLSNLLQSTNWPGYAGRSMASKWNASNPAREADQVAWNIFGLATSMQDQFNCGNPPAIFNTYQTFGGYQAKNFLYQWSSTNPNTVDAPGRNTRFSPYPTAGLGVYISPSGPSSPSIQTGPFFLGYGLWSGTVSGSRYSAEGRPISVDEIGVNARMIQAPPTGTVASTMYNLGFSFEYDLTVPYGFFLPGYGPNQFPVSEAGSTEATTLVVTHLEYTVTYVDSTGNTQTSTIVANPGNNNPASADPENGPDLAGKLVIPAYQVAASKTKTNPTTGAFDPNNVPPGATPSGSSPGPVVGVPDLAINTVPTASPTNRMDIVTYVDNKDPKSQEFIDTAHAFPAGVKIGNIKVKFALLLQNQDPRPLQLSPLTTPSGSAVASQASLESNAATATIPFNGAISPVAPALLTTAPYQAFGTYNYTNLLVMKVDDVRLAGNASGWGSVSAPGDFGQVPPTAFAFSSPTNSQLSKYALPPMSDGSNAYPFNKYNDMDLVSPGMLFYASTGMQSGTPWTTLSLQPGGFINGSDSPAAPIPAARGTAPPDYLLLDLLQTPYRYENMNSSQGKVNINSLIYPSYFNMTRLLPLEALFANTKVNGITISPGVGNAAETLAKDIQAQESTLNGFRYSGELCEVAHLGSDGSYGSTDFQKEGLMRNLAGLITTRSNSFGIWGAAEALVEQPNGHLTVLSDKRFHAIVERYVWPGVDAFYGNAYVNAGGTYPNNPGGPGNWKDTIDGPDTDNPNFASLAPSLKPVVPSVFTANNIPLNMNPPTLNSAGAPAVTFNTVTTNKILENANNPLCPYMRYRVVNFRYISD